MALPIHAGSKIDLPTLSVQSTTFSPAARDFASRCAPAVLDPTSGPEWDARLAQFPDATIFHTRAWARVLSDSYGYAPLYLVVGKSAKSQLSDSGSNATDEQAAPSDSSAALPLMEVKSWLTGHRGLSLPFTDACPPLGVNFVSISHILEEALRLARSRGWRYLEFRGTGHGRLAAGASTTFWGHSLDLAVGEQALLAGCDSATSRAVRKAGKSGVEVAIGHDMEAVHEFYSLHCRTRKRHGQPPQPFRFFANIQRRILATGDGFIVIIRRHGNAIAANMFFQHGRAAVYKFGASDHRFQEMRASNLAMWQGIRECVRLRCTSLDLGRTSVGQEGLRRFKLGWGTTETRIEYHRYDVRADRFVDAPDRANARHCRIFRRLPLALSRLAGEILYRHVG